MLVEVTNDWNPPIMLAIASFSDCAILADWDEEACDMGLSAEQNGIEGAMCVAMSSFTYSSVLIDYQTMQPTFIRTIDEEDE